jgi:tRNA nucleotidyltransferase (CCA-adding enzyme)
MKDFHQFREDFGLNLLSQKPSNKIIEWQEAGFLKRCIQPLDKCVGIEQDTKFHVDTVFEHCIKTCDNVPPILSLRWAGLLHDIGKAQTKGQHILCGLTYPKEKKAVTYCRIKKRKCYAKCEHAVLRVTFYKHELASERLAKAILRVFKVPQQTFAETVRLIASHMYMFDCAWTDKAVGRFVRKTGITAKDLEDPDNFPLFQLRIADRKSRGLEPVTAKQRDFENRLRAYFGIETRKEIKCNSYE